MQLNPMPDHYKIHLLSNGHPGDWRTLLGRRVGVVPSPAGPTLRDPLDPGDDLAYPYVLDVDLAMQVARIGDQWYTTNMERVVYSGLVGYGWTFLWLDRVSPPFLLHSSALPLGGGHLLRPVVSRDPRTEPVRCANHVPVDTGLAWSYCRKCDATLRFVNLNWEVQHDPTRRTEGEPEKVQAGW